MTRGHLKGIKVRRTRFHAAHRPIFTSFPVDQSLCPPAIAME
jgi:hypothetical protein